MDLKLLSKRQLAPGADGSNMPSLWVFLIIVVAVLLALVIGTSAIMQLIQARQRRSLSRRIARGEVDLELLGLKRLNVPRELVDKMPQYTYTAAESSNIKVPDPAAMPTATRDNRRSTMYAQTTCSICLDDFVEDETAVRELPCNHIFHPECIDPFLVNNSSLCPLCKKSALPAGYCPFQVTNVMVRRERLGRNMRDGRRTRASALQNSIRPYVRGGTRATPSRTQPIEQPSTPPVETQDQDTELGIVQSHQPDAEAPPPEIAIQGPEARRAWRRERLARQHSREFDEQGEVARLAEAKRPFWRRWLGLS